MTGNLFYPILGHVLFNLISLLRLNSISESALETPSYGYPPPLLVGISLVVLVLAVIRLRKLYGQRGQA
jgi:hypothetical protein